ncbi:MAG: hypothetical protein II767_05200 [Proteobacteria bacterium]|nr:hypothetical protein [Pseudomonadota bacterium]MBQ4359634.1 hypothetical protein [Pseudomonadota bacterium]
MSHVPYDYYERLEGPDKPEFDTEAAYAFLSSHSDPINDMRLKHWSGDIDDVSFWDVMETYRGANGGFKGGLDPDYLGDVGSVHTTIEAMRIMVAHQQFEGPHVDETLEFVRSVMQPDGTWQEIPDVLANPRCPAWYQPAQFRIYETSCIAGYGLELGAYDLWTNAVRYVRNAWMQMPFAETAHPYWAVLLLLGRSTTSSDRSIALDALDNLGAFIRRRKIDAYDCSAVVEILNGLDFPEIDDMLVRVYRMLGAAQDPDDGGIRTEYGSGLRAGATFNALMAVALLMQRGLIGND